LPITRLEKPIPRGVLALSGMSLLVPVVMAFWLNAGAQGVETLLWLTALIPAFVLSYYRGWKGSTVALACGMVALAGTNLAVVSLGVAAPNWELLFAVVTSYVGLTLGIGWLSERLRSDRNEAQLMALTDSLTGLANRRFAERILDQAFALAGRGIDLSVVLLDVDHFKAFNDRHGHVAGDQVLRVLGFLLGRATRRSDLAARYGGEEFLVLLHNCGGGGALTFVERFRTELAEAELPGEPVTISAGIATYQFGMDSPEDLVVAADKALYAAKAAGRNCARIASPAVPEQSPEVAKAARNQRKSASRS